MENRYWVFDWMDKHRTTSMREIERLLNKEPELNSLRKLASESGLSTQDSPVTERSILAGHGLDLSAHPECFAGLCMGCQADRVLRPAWHYFDSVVVADPIAHELLCHWDSDRTSVVERLCSHFRILLHLREIGAESLLRFREKPSRCLGGWRKHADDLGLTSLPNRGVDLIRELGEEAAVDVTNTDEGRVEYALRHPEFPDVVHGRLDQDQGKARSSPEIREAIARDVVSRSMAVLISDVAAARDLDIPLGATIQLHRKLLNPAFETARVSDVVFHLDLPFLEGIPIKALVRIRNDEQSSFERFRDSLRRAGREVIAQKHAADVAALCDQVRLDIIEPELRKIRERLAAAERVLAKKSAVGIAMAALATTCGLMVGLPPQAALGVGLATTISTTITAGSRYIEEKQQVTMSDMYFLWTVGKGHEHQF